MPLMAAVAAACMTGIWAVPVRGVAGALVAIALACMAGIWAVPVRVVAGVVLACMAGSCAVPVRDAAGVAVELCSEPLAAAPPTIGICAVGERAGFAGSPLTAAILVSRLMIYFYSVVYVFKVPNHFGKDEETVLREIVGILEHGIKK